MPSEIILKKIAAEAGKLVNAQAINDPALGAMIAVHLAFEKGGYTIRAKPLRESIEILHGEAAFQDRRKSSRGFLSDAVGKEVRQTWSLINQRGEEDGVQLEFVDAADQSSIEFQFVVAASRLKVGKIEG